MALPPRNRAVNTSVPDDTDTAPAEWFAPVLQQINQFMNETQFALDKGISSRNLAQQTYTADFTTGANVADVFPLKINATLSTPVEHVQILQKTVVTKGGSFSGASDASHWSLAPGNVLQINEITGLNPNTRYRFVLRFT